MLKSIAEGIRGLYVRQGSRGAGESFVIASVAIEVSRAVAKCDKDFDRAQFLIDCGLDPYCKAVAEAKEER